MEEEQGPHDRFVEEYESLARRYRYHVPEALFGMGYEFVCPAQRILDVGIGTGLASELFARAGLEVYGIDGSERMSEVCRKKGVVKEIKILDVRTSSLPYGEGFFDAVICCGVLQFISDPDGLFSEIARVLKAGGVFLFSILTQLEVEGEVVSWMGSKRYRRSMKEGVMVYIHSPEYILGLIAEKGWTVRKDQRFLLGDAPPSKAEVMQVFVVQA